MKLKRIELKNHTRKEEDKNLSFRVFSLDKETLQEYLQPHKKDHFCIFIAESGEMNIHIEDRVKTLKPGKISVIFPDQVHFVSNIGEDLAGKILLFEEVLFCSDILKNDLSAYNVHLSTHLNCIFLSPEEFSYNLRSIAMVEAIYHAPSLIKKEQARFYIKIFLLSLIESVHGQHPLMHQEMDKTLYIRFKKMLNEQYKAEQTVSYYSSELGITPKKLNAITKKHCGGTALYVIHERILKEIKRLLLFSDLSHKEIAFDLGFSSPAAFNKFVRAKLRETPTALQQELGQMYNT